MEKKNEKEKLIKQVGNSGYTCRCGAYMYANIYEDKAVCMCPQCGDAFTVYNKEEKP